MLPVGSSVALLVRLSLSVGKTHPSGGTKVIVGVEPPVPDKLAVKPYDYKGQ